MSLFTSTSGVEIYAGLTATLAYVNDMLGAGAAAFLALSTGDQNKALVSITRYIDRWPWQGVADAAGGTTLQFPRAGLVDAAGATIGDAAQLAIVAKAVGELAALVAADSSVLTAADTGNNVKRADAGGGTGVEFFNPTSAKLGTATPLPQAVQQLLGAWLASAGAAVGGDGAAGRATSDFARCREYDKTGAF